MRVSNYVKAGLGILVLFVLSATPLQAEEGRLVEVFAKIYTMEHGSGVDSNSTFIITKEGVIVIDTRPTPIEAKKVLAEIRKLTDLPIVYTINTHFHGDHTFGNQVFNASKVIIAHKNVRKFLVKQKGQDHLNFFKTMNLPGTDEIKITPPNLVYEDGIDLYLGEYYLQLIHPGRGHTNGDTFIYLPSLRTIITGDLVFNKKIPYLGHGYIDEWIASLVKLEDLDAEIIVPGHGSVGGKPLITQMKHYLMQLRTYVVDAIRRGLTLKETQDEVRPILTKKYHDWKQLNWLDGNIQRAFLEFSLKEGA